MKNNHKSKKKKQYKTNLRRLPSPIVTAQTQYHLYAICAANGWGEKDVGRAIDLVTREFQERRRNWE